MNTIPLDDLNRQFDTYQIRTLASGTTVARVQGNGNYTVALAVTCSEVVEFRPGVDGEYQDFPGQTARCGAPLTRLDDLGFACAAGHAYTRDPERPGEGHYQTPEVCKYEHANYCPHHDYDHYLQRQEEQDLRDRVDEYLLKRDFAQREAEAEEEAYYRKLERDEDLRRETH